MPRLAPPGAARLRNLSKGKKGSKVLPPRLTALSVEPDLDNISENKSFKSVQISVFYMIHEHDLCHALISTSFI